MFTQRCSQPQLLIYTETPIYREIEMTVEEPQREEGVGEQERVNVFYDNPALQGRHQKEAENMQKYHIKFSLHW